MPKKDIQLTAVAESPLGEYIRRKRDEGHPYGYQVEVALALSKERGHAISSPVVSRWARGVIIPSPIMQVLIERVTKGEVTVAQWTEFAKRIGRKVNRPLARSAANRQLAAEKRMVVQAKE